jgi:hypothetical protein
MNNYENELYDFFDQLEDEWEVEKAPREREQEKKLQDFYKYATGKYEASLQTTPQVSNQEKIIDELEELEFMLGNFQKEYADGVYDVRQFFRETIHLIKESQYSIHSIAKKVDSLVSTPDSGEVRRKMQRIQVLEEELVIRENKNRQLSNNLRSVELDLKQTTLQYKEKLAAMKLTHQIELQETKEKLEKYERSRKVSGTTRTVISVPNS